MFKRLGLLALMLAGTGAAVLPTAALAEEQYNASRDSYYHSDCDGDRHEVREIRDHGRDEWQEHETRDRRDGDKWRDRDYRGDRYDRTQHRYCSFGFEHRR
jgi:hypothetical protein